ncbi:DUF4476 domain-containing protein [Taibaiella koreensis]|uniref:DUF4476 domain-containing protein n=1 Tax=Taibaiella koreensis TaxID=1268548 RepID=UPI0013C345CD|nr:DUF4476 domain-containing protein [Taibaiella koreensis]
MKRIIVLALAILCFLPAVFAQRSDRSTLRIRLSDGGPLLVTINGRDFRKIGRSITIADIPRKRQNMQVYRYRAYADGKGGKAELVYSGTIKVQKGSTYDCIVDIGTRKFRMLEVASLQPLAQQPPFDPRRDQPLGQDEGTATDNSQPVADDTPMEMPPDRTVSARLQPLKTAMDKEDADSKKLAEARKFIAANSVTSAEVTNIAGWIFFDDNRLTFAKAAYARVSDKQNFASVGSVFTLPESKKDFEDFLRNK